MPELPEVETIARALAKTTVGRRITAIKFFRQDLREPIPTTQMQAALSGSTIASVTRRSKYILMKTEDSCGIFHLGMTGNFIMAKSAKPRLAHTHLVMSLADELGQKTFLHYVDPRRFGRIGYCANAELKTWPWLAGLGPEPLNPKLNLAAHLQKAAAKRRTAVKSFLMDNDVVVGVGNIYAAEALFRARVRPDRPANQLSQAAWQGLSEHIRSVLKEAIKAGGTSFRDFKNTEGKPGYFRISLAVYNRKGEPCLNCQSPIACERIGGRSSFFCSHCQK